MLKQEELAFIKAISTLQVTPALLRELRTALSSRKRRTVVSAGIRGRALEEVLDHPSVLLADLRASAKPTSWQTRTTLWSLP